MIIKVDRHPRQETNKLFNQNLKTRYQLYVTNESFKPQIITYLKEFGVPKKQ